MSELSAAAQLALAAAMQAGAAEADAVAVESDSLEARVRGEEIDFVKQARERKLGVRALVRGARGTRSAITSSSDLSEQAVRAIALEAVALARATADDPAAGLPDGDFADPAALPDLALANPADRGVQAEALIDAARRAESAARAVDPRIENSEGSSASASFARIAYANSAGFAGAYSAASHALFSEPIARADGSMQRDYWMTAARSLAALESPEAVGRRAAERALRRLGACRVATCEVPVIFDPLTAASLWGQVAGLISGYSIYRGTSYLAGKLGEIVASDQVTLTDDACRPAGLGSRPFDGEGLPSRRTAVIERGRLASYLLDTYSARKVGGRSTGSASRSASSAPGVGASNLGLAPGSASLEEIIADTPRGFLVTELIGMGFNPTTGDYSRGAAGLWIEGGELAYPVEEVTIAANFADMLRGIDAVGSDLLWLSRIGSPSVRVARMTVAGGKG
jgi:PmbA protein